MTRPGALLCLLLLAVTLVPAVSAGPPIVPLGNGPVLSVSAVDPPAGPFTPGSAVEFVFQTEYVCPHNAYHPEPERVSLRASADASFAYVQDGDDEWVFDQALTCAQGPHTWIHQHKVRVMITDDAPAYGVGVLSYHAQAASGNTGNAHVRLAVAYTATVAPAERQIAVHTTPGAVLQVQIPVQLQANAPTRIDGTQAADPNGVVVTIDPGTICPAAHCNGRVYVPMRVHVADDAITGQYAFPLTLAVASVEDPVTAAEAPVTVYVQVQGGVAGPVGEAPAVPLGAALALLAPALARLRRRASS